MTKTTRLTPDFGRPYLRAILDHVRTLNNRKEAQACLEELERRPKESTNWDDLFRAEIAALQVLPKADLERRVLRLREEFKILYGDRTYADYIGYLKTRAGDADEEELRADACYLMREIQRMRLAYNTLQKVQDRAILVAAVVVAVLFVALMLMARPWLPVGGPWILGSVLILGATGGVFSLLMRSRGLPATEARVLQVSVVHLGIMPACRFALRSLPLICAIEGALGAGILFLMFRTGLLTGNFIPNLNPLSPNDLPALPELAKLLVWSFIAGFSERLVPDLLGQICCRAEPTGVPPPADFGPVAAGGDDQTTTLGATLPARKNGHGGPVHEPSLAHPRATALPAPPGGATPTFPGIRSKMIATPRLVTHTLLSGYEEAEPVLFVHGNASSATFWEEIMAKLPPAYRGIAPDLRGFGFTEDKVIDATRGYGDWVDDLLALTRALGLKHYHVVGHSLGGGLLFSLLPAAAEQILSATLVAPCSPFGYGGTKDTMGTMCWPEDASGSGASLVNPGFWQLVAAGDRETSHPNSPRNVMRCLYWKPPFVPAWEEALLSAVLTTKTGPERYPGDSVGSKNWPFFAPGLKGPVNALSPKYVGSTIRRFLELQIKPPILWLRGSEDAIVSDASELDLGVLGASGKIQGWPGSQIFPPQPMVSQTREVLRTYANNNGRYWEKIITDSGHTPFVEKPDEFMSCLLHHLARATVRHG